MNSSDPYSHDNLGTLQSKLGINFNDLHLLKTAITTKAAQNEHLSRVKNNNERLEFLGDSVLKFLLSENLYKGSTNPEGKMTIMRTEIENNHTLATIAKELEIKPHLFLSNGEKHASTKGEESYLANSLEAIIGAIYLDQGIDETRGFVEKRILQKLLQILLTEDVRNPITPLQEICQKSYGQLPKYVFTEVMVENKPQFKSEIIVNGSIIAEAIGTSKREAKRKSAKKALFILSN